MFTCKNAPHKIFVLGAKFSWADPANIQQLVKQHYLGHDYELVRKIVLQLSFFRVKFFMLYVIFIFICAIIF